MYLSGCGCGGSGLGEAAAPCTPYPECMDATNGTDVVVETTDPTADSAGNEMLGWLLSLVLGAALFKAGR